MKKRSLLFPLLVIITGFIFVARLFFLQVVHHDSNEISLSGSAIKRIYTYPERGFVYDRNGKLLVANEQTYDVKVIPNEVKAFDTIEFCNLLKIDKNYLTTKLDRARNYSPWLPSVFLSQLSKEDYAYLQEKIHKYKGFSIQRKSLRKYPHKSAANVLGYINEVNEQLARKNPYYEQGELVGTQGIEKEYEDILRGTKGVSYKLRNRLNKVIGPYKEGIYDTLPQPGKDLSLTIDLDLQAYGELLMSNKRGGIVAIEPSTGEILALVTAPSYDPNLMVGRERSKNSVMLFNDTINKPMFDRGLQSTYAPGSPFKLVEGLIGLQENVITPNTGFYCHHGYRYGYKANNFMGCHCGITGRPIDLRLGIAKSCNSYFSNVYKLLLEKYDSSQESLTHWANHLQSFGLGDYLGYDLPIGAKGFIPSSEYYDKIYPRKTWRYSTTISNAIGQGEILTTPIQLANMIAAIANRGFYFTPHILKKINGNPIKIEKYTTKKHTTIDAKNFEPIINGMSDVYKSGTAKHVQIKDIEICGKTGTVENFIRKNGVKYQVADHSIFVAFAPKDNPKIALAIFVENGGFGSTIAAPIASLMIEKYLKGTTSLTWWGQNSQSLIEKSLEAEYKKQLSIQTLEKSQN
ncbi:penicillin-binding protein 2 [Wenyingzhuangia marina]|uniref:Penicillin-binding protein 2 n=1 Tax=Wenyingzhuangia marina TaxID=1195760 RepID=A0A1M5WGU5_9FLAO|nr:penicillin-binding protein 2 [Wenyingzhuangia marina]GGF80961.1 penicillin-binding protein 2 [Wenyingzhuangia marina]SHH86732.1 penicillin-binding protein 2 [Wenyingzhuangia marina]